MIGAVEVATATTTLITHSIITGLHIQDGSISLLFCRLPVVPMLFLACSV